MIAFFNYLVIFLHFYSPLQHMRHFFVMTFVLGCCQLSEAAYFPLVRWADDFCVISSVSCIICIMTTDFLSLLICENSYSNRGPLFYMVILGWSDKVYFSKSFGGLERVGRCSERSFPCFWQFCFGAMKYVLICSKLEERKKGFLECLS